MKVFELRGTLAHAIEMNNSLNALQDYVDGYIEVIYLDKELAMIINEDGKLWETRENIFATVILRHYLRTTDYIAGKALIAGVCGDDFVGLKEEQIGNLLSICVSGNQNKMPDEAATSIERKRN